jgi:hypothetical protein
MKSLPTQLCLRRKQQLPLGIQLLPELPISVETTAVEVASSARAVAGQERY